MITAEETRLGTPARSYRVGLVAGLPGILMLPLVLWMSWVRATGGWLADFMGTPLGNWIVGVTWLASLFCSSLGQCFAPPWSCRYLRRPWPGCTASPDGSGSRLGISRLVGPARRSHDLVLVTDDLSGS